VRGRGWETARKVLVLSGLYALGGVEFLVQEHPLVVYFTEEILCRGRGSLREIKKDTCGGMMQTMKVPKGGIKYLDSI
jgi:hypothetical protein